MVAKRALVVGGGIGGLAAGIALRRAEFEVTVLERAQMPREVGAGLAIWPNGTRALEALGVPDLPSTGVTRLTLRTWRGRDLVETPFAGLRKRYGSEFKIVSRRQLHLLLLQALGPEHVSPGSEVIGFREPGRRVAVTLSDGRDEEADLLVGADGLRSAVRRQQLGDGEPRYLGCTAWRGMTDLAGSGLEPDQGINWWGPGGEFGALPVSGGGVYWFATANVPEGEVDPADGRQADLQRRFAGWQPPIPDLIARTDPGAILRNDIYDRPPARGWSSDRVTLVGDAAHPMAPNTAQGACQALEDAAALAACLEGGVEVAAALKEYERRRWNRASRFQTLGHQLSRLVQTRSRPLGWLRDQSVRLAPSWAMQYQLDQTLRS